MNINQWIKYHYDFFHLFFCFSLFLLGTKWNNIFLGWIWMPNCQLKYIIKHLCLAQFKGFDEKKPLLTCWSRILLITHVGFMILTTLEFQNIVTGFVFISVLSYNTNTVYVMCPQVNSMLCILFNHITQYQILVVPQLEHQDMCLNKHYIM